MAHLDLFFLGPPQLEREGEALKIDARKSVALLAYLAVTGQRHRRETLVTLLWPESEPSRARSILRRNLSTLNKTLAGVGLAADRESIGLDPQAEIWLDVEQFQVRVEAWQKHGHPESEVCPDCLATLSEAVALYRGDFLAGFSLRDAPDFDEWQFFQTESLRQALASALARLVAGYQAQANYRAAISYARRWLALDPLHELVHRHLMALYDQAGQRAAALRQYQACVELLETELGLPPATETTALYERIRRAPVRNRQDRGDRDVTPNRDVTAGHIVIGDVFALVDPEKNLLGQGAMGAVYRGLNTQTGETVAIKVLKPDLVAHNPDSVARFVQEGETLRRLNHPNIVTMLAAEEKEGQHYLVMEYVGGGSLRDLLAEGPPPIERLLEIALDLADALTRAHRLNIIHRDLKPGNVLLADDGTPRLTDFGLARVADSPPLTQTGVVMGTVDYLSPEACHGQSLDTRSDIWAFGVLLYELLAGEPPFSGETITATLAAILSQTAPDLSQRRPEVPDALADLIYRMLAKDPSQRPPSVRLVGAELEAILAGWEVGQRGKGARGQRRRGVERRKAEGVALEGRAEGGQVIDEGETEDEIRIVTILFADMSQSVETTWDHPPEEGAEMVNRLLAAMVEVLVKYEARVDRFLGDGVLAVFGVPQVHEDDPRRAILAALEIQAAGQELGVAVKVGINTGPVYFGRVGSAAHREMTVMGPAVNLASRLQDQAEAGEILVGQATYRQTERAFRFSPLSLDLRGIPEPVNAYRMHRPRRQPRKARGIEGLRAELIGRDEELAKLKTVLAGLTQGQGAMVSLIGEAGIGKSRLVTELKQFARQTFAFQGAAFDGQGSRLGSNEPQSNRPASKRQSQNSALSPQPSELHWLEGRCLEMNQTTSYWPFIDLLRVYLAWGPADDEPRRAGRVVSVLQGMADRGELQAGQVEEIGPLLGNLLNLQFGTDWDDRLKNADPQQIRHRTFQALYDFFVALACQGPLVLVLEDLHWADSLSLDLITQLMAALAASPLLLLCVYRPEHEHKCWRLATVASRKCPAQFTELTLRELTPEQSRHLVESLLQIKHLPATVKGLILSKAQGNPFFVEEVIRALIDAELVYQAGDQGRDRAEVASLTVPESIQSVILSRVDRLEPALKQTLQIASVIGQLFQQPVLAQLIPPETDLAGDLWALEDGAFIYQERAFPAVAYSFKHVLVQEAVYQTLLRRRRAEVHGQVAAVLEALYPDNLASYYEQLAYHYDQSAQYQQNGVLDKAITYLLKAGEKARRSYLNDEAIGYFQRALERLDEAVTNETHQRQQLAAHKGLGRLYVGIGQLSEAETHLQQAIVLRQELGVAPHELARLYYWLGELLWWQGKYTERIRIGEAGLALLGKETESAEAAMLNATVAWGYYNQGNPAKAREYTLRNAQFIQRVPYSEELRSAYIHILITYAELEKDTKQALKWAQVLKQQAQQHHDWRALGSVHEEIGDCILAPTGDLRGAISQARQSLAWYAKIGDNDHKNRVLNNLMWAFFHLGDLKEAEVYARRSLELAEPKDVVPVVADVYLGLGEIFFCRGAWEKAIGVLQEALQRAQKANWRLAEAGTIARIGHVYLAQGKQAEALQQFETAWSLVADLELQQQFIDPLTYVWLLSGLEVAYQDGAAYQSFCRRFRKEHPEAGGTSFGQWFLAPLEAGAAGELPLPSPDLIHDAFVEPLAAEWIWHDPFGDCSFARQNGLEIHAANGRGLWHINLSAPRLLRPVAGDFFVQTICAPLAETQPAIGGLLLWQNKENYLRLEWGTFGPHDISFIGFLGNKDIAVGRGCLPFDSAGHQSVKRVFLRLERVGRQVNAFCSLDGANWFTVGQVEFPGADPLQVGLHAIGDFDRIIYPGAFPEGTAIRFEAFWLWPHPHH